MKKVQEEVWNHYLPALTFNPKPPPVPDGLIPIYCCYYAPPCGGNAVPLAPILAEEFPVLIPRFRFFALGGRF